MRPVFLKLGPLEFHSYVVMLALAFLLGVFLFFRLNERRPDPFPVTPMGALWVFAGILVGSKVYYVFQYGTLGDLLHVWRVWEGGLVSYGGLIGGGLAALLYLRYARVPVRPVADMVLLVVPLSHAVGRVGCFLNGCCFGRPTAVSWGVCYPRGGTVHDHLLHRQAETGWLGLGAEHALPVHPTQLYSSIGLLTIFFVLLAWYPRRRVEGIFLVAYPGLYGAQRFVVECFRADTPRVVLGMTLSQLISLVLAISAVIAYAVIAVWVRRAGTCSNSDAKG